MNNEEFRITCLKLVDSGRGLEAIEVISKMLYSKQTQENHEYREAVNSLVAIKKINKGRNKAIDALCELESKSEKQKVINPLYIEGVPEVETYKTLN